MHEHTACPTPILTSHTTHHPTPMHNTTPHPTPHPTPFPTPHSHPTAPHPSPLVFFLQKYLLKADFTSKCNPFSDVCRNDPLLIFVFVVLLSVHSTCMYIIVLYTIHIIQCNVVLTVHIHFASKSPLPFSAGCGDDWDRHQLQAKFLALLMSCVWFSGQQSVHTEKHL